MLRLYLAGKSGTRDISQLVESLVWSGDKSSAARKLTASILQGGGWPVPRTGDGMVMGDGDETLFKGYIVQRSADSERSRLTVTCHDQGMYLHGNDGTYQFRGETAEGIVRTVCRDKGIPVASLAATGIGLSRRTGPCCRRWGTAAPRPSMGSWSGTSPTGPARTPPLRPRPSLTTAAWSGA